MADGETTKRTQGQRKRTGLEMGQQEAGVRLLEAKESQVPLEHRFSPLGFQGHRSVAKLQL